MSAAGAPPPPPPPPMRSFDSLPAELLLDIISRLSINEFINLALAIYPILEFHGIVPPLTPEVMDRITHSTMQDINSEALAKATKQSSKRLTALSHLPIELNDEIMEYMEPADQLAWLFSHRDMIRHYVSVLSKNTKNTLWDTMRKSMQRSKKK